MVKGVQRTQPAESSTPQRLPTMAAGQNPSDPLTILNTPMAHGALAGFNPFAGMGVNMNDPNMVSCPAAVHEPQYNPQFADAEHDGLARIYGSSHLSNVPTRVCRADACDGSNALKQPANAPNAPVRTVP